MELLLVALLLLLWLLAGPRQSSYERYIHSAAWRRKRREKLRQSNYTCEDCGWHSWRYLHVHHLTYARFTNERLSDLQVLCRPCHRLRHPSGVL